MKASKFIPLIATAVFAFLPACGTRSASVEVEDADQIVDTSSSTTNSDLFDGYNAGNLFDTDLNGDANPSQTSSQAQNTLSQPVPESVASCVSSNSGLTFDANGYSTNGYSSNSSSPACFSQTQTQNSSSMYSANLFYSQSIQDLRFMRAVYLQIASKRPNTQTMSREQRRIHFIVARLAMVRGWRAIVLEQRRNFPWTQSVQTGYGGLESTMYGMMQNYRNDLSPYFR
jgi:hypothetical protein